MIDPDRKVFAHDLMLKTNKDKYRRWDEGYFNRLFKDLEAAKVWVCGPPIMQEGFDRAAMANPNAKVEFAAL